MPKRIRYTLSKEMRRHIVRCFPIQTKSGGALQAWSWQGLTLHLVFYPDSSLTWKQEAGTLRVCKIEKEANFYIDLEPEFEKFREAIRRRLSSVEVRWAKVKEKEHLPIVENNNPPSGLASSSEIPKKAKLRIKIS